MLIDSLLWGLSFLGVVVIYVAAPILRLFCGEEYAPIYLYLFKSVGIVMSAVAIFALYILGKFI